MATGWEGGIEMHVSICVHVLGITRIRNGSLRPRACCGRRLGTVGSIGRSLMREMEMRPMAGLGISYQYGYITRQMGQIMDEK